MAEPQKYVATDDDRTEAWKRAEEFAQDVYMTDDELGGLLTPMGFSNAEYEFEQQNSDHNNGITIGGSWDKGDMDLDAFLDLVEERGSRTLYVGEGLVGFKPTIYHESLIRQAGYAGNSDLRAWFDALQALDIQRFEFELGCEPGGDGDIAKLFYMITDTIRRHNDAQLHDNYENQLSVMVEEKQEELDCKNQLNSFIGAMLDDSGDSIACVDENSRSWSTVKSYVDDRHILRRMLVNKGAEELADLLTGCLFNHPSATVEAKTPEAEVEGTPV